MEISNMSKIITKTEILKNFENKEFVQINFPKSLKDDEPIFKRSELQKLDHFNTVYKDGGKYYLEDNTGTLVRLSKRVFGKEVYNSQIWENLEFCLYLAGYDLKKAVKVYNERY